MPSYLHSGDLGDIIFALPIIRHLGGGTLYLTTRPGTREPMTPARFEFIKPLLEAQSYITGVEMHKGQKITHDFTGFREGCVANTTLAEVQRRFVLPIGIDPDYSQPWLETSADSERRRIGIVIARSPRYHNPEWVKLWPKVMRQGELVQFVGLKDEHEAFCKEFGAVHHIHVQNALQMAEIIASSTIFIGNQSLPFALAEGMKVNRILETSLRGGECNCIYKGGDVTHVRKAEEWPLKVTTGRLMLALQFSPHDAREAEDLAKLIVSMEPTMRDDCEVAVCPRDDVNTLTAELIADVFRKRFITHVVKSNRSGRGWPDGCNDLWQSTMMKLHELRLNGGTTCDAVLTFEADTVPGTLDWIDRLSKEWTKARNQKKLAFGHLCDAGGPDGWHINGNLVIDINAIKLFPELQTAKAAWDMAHRRLLRENSLSSKLILNLWGNHNQYTIDEFMDIKFEGVRPALIHGIKNSSGRDAARAGIQNRS